MASFNIESYLDGTLTGAEKEAFEQEMRQNQGFRDEVELHRSVLEALQGQRIREKVTTALKESVNPIAPKSKFSNRWFILLLLPLVFIGYWFLLPKNTPPISTPAQSPSPTPKIEETLPNEHKETIAPTPEKTEPTTPNAPKPKTPAQKSPPIAETKTPSPIPPLNLPINIRGKSEDNQAWNALLDSIWVSQFPVIHSEKLRNIYLPVVQLLKDQDYNMAFVRLRMLERKMPENDTVLLLKGYCLTELREGQQALNYFDKINDRSTTWKTAMDWYRALSYLVIGDTERAGELFNEMSTNPNHPFQKQSQNALEILK